MTVVANALDFLHSSVDHFVKDNRDKVKRGERFSQLTDNDREEIIDRAKRLARSGGCPAEVARRIADQMGRSVETIRYTIKQFDERHPEQAVFPNQTGPLNLEMKERIYADYLAGKNVDAIARRYCRTKTTVYRVVNEMRARAIMELPLDFMDSPEFHRKAADTKILADSAGTGAHPASCQAAGRTAPLPGIVVRNGVVDPRTGSSLVPQIQLPEVSGARKLRESLDPARPRAADDG